MRGSSAASAESWRTTRRPVALPPACTTRRTEWPPSRPSARCPKRSASKRTPSACRSRTRSGASRTSDLGGRAPHQRAAGELGVAQVQLEAVVGGERGREAALRPVARGLRQRRGRDQHHVRALARGAQRRVQPGCARAHHGDVGLVGTCRRKGGHRGNRIARRVPAGSAAVRAPAGSAAIGCSSFGARRGSRFSRSQPTRPCSAVLSRPSGLMLAAVRGPGRRRRARPGRDASAWRPSSASWMSSACVAGRRGRRRGRSGGGGRCSCVVRGRRRRGCDGARHGGGRAGAAGELDERGGEHSERQRDHDR